MPLSLDFPVLLRETRGDSDSPSHMTQPGEKSRESCDIYAGLLAAEGGLRGSIWNGTTSLKGTIYQREQFPWFFFFSVRALERAKREGILGDGQIGSEVSEQMMINAEQANSWWRLNWTNSAQQTRVWSLLTKMIMNVMSGLWRRILNKNDIVSDGKQL